MRLRKDRVALDETLRKENVETCNCEDAVVGRKIQRIKKIKKIEEIEKKREERSV